MLYLPHALSPEPAPYHQVARGSDQRWWRPLLGLLTLVVVGVITLLLVSFAPLFFVSFSEIMAWYRDMESGSVDLSAPGGFIFLMASLIVLIPVALLATWVGLRVRPGFLLSVAGRLRWRWLLVSAAVFFAVYAPLLIGAHYLEGGLEFNPAANLPLALVLVIILVPLQSAAEELVFRGFILQFFGSLLPGRVFSLVVGTVFSAVLFAAAHGSFHYSTFLFLGLMALVACLLTYFTGGLEAAIAMHAANNTTIFLITAFTGPSETLVTESTSIEPSVFLMDFALYAVTVPVILWLARRMGINRFHDPALAPAPNANYLIKEYERGRVYPEHAALYPAGLAAHLGFVAPTPDQGAPGQVSGYPGTIPNDRF